MAHLKIASIAKSFGSFEALTQIDLSVEAGEFVCLLGESGCGKTTLLRLIAGLETATSGELLLNGEDLTQTPAHARNIGMVFQSLALFPHLSVLDNIAYGLRMKGVGTLARRARAGELLETVGLTGMGARRVSQLSGGQRQRVAIARALAVEPSLFLMDEPFSALDAGLREHLQVEVRKLQQFLGITTIFVTHDQREAMALADRIVVMNAGRIEQAAAPAELYARPASEFVATFIGSNNVMAGDVYDGQLSLFGTHIGAIEAPDGTHTFALRPEHVRLSGGPLAGTVTFSRILGATTETEIDVAGHKLLQTQVTDPAQTPNVGDEVGVGFDPAHLWRIPG